MATDHDSPIAANEQAYRDLGVQERSYPDDGMSDRNVRIILRDLVRRIEALEAEREMRDAATTPGLGWVSLHRHVEAARCSIAGARLRKSLLVVTPSEYEALMDIVDAANRTGDDAVLAAVMRWKDSHAID